MKKDIGFAGLGTWALACRRTCCSTVSGVRLGPEGEAVDALVEQGASAAESPGSWPAAADVAITILWGDDASRKVVLERMIPAARPGTIFIEMSTVSAAMQRALGQAAERARLQLSRRAGHRQQGRGRCGRTHRARQRTARGARRAARRARGDGEKRRLHRWTTERAPRSSSATISFSRWSSPDSRRACARRMLQASIGGSRSNLFTGTAVALRR